ncbi:hypothetical protein COCNU_01G009440 [Cocos nucifera]|uniref:Uncharacterized protein n=1 Tax=Cocos nucifera TaxID=13894 RepID=A0A8K0MV24_COCNU|nr:hypothetical protein COCNU_01G009440 [Cocos nucifera]
MPLFLLEEESRLLSHDAATVSGRADAVIRDLHLQVDTTKAEKDAVTIAAEQTCALLEQRYESLSDDLARLRSENSQLSTYIEQRLSELAEVQAENYRLHLKAVEKDGKIERLSLETVEQHKSKRQLLELVEQKDAEIREKNATIQSYLDKIELCSSKDTAASNEERFVAELSTMHMTQVENEYIEKLEKEASLRKDLEKVLHEIEEKAEIILDEREDGRKDLVLLFEDSQEVSKKGSGKVSERARNLEEYLAKLREELTSARSEHDKMALESSFARERLDSFMKEFEHQREEANTVSARNMELTHLLVDYQKRLLESSDSSQACEENSRKLSMESSLDTMQSTEEVRENARAVERRKQEEHFRQVERDCAEAKKELQEERYNVQILMLDKEKAMENSMKHVEEMRKDLADAWRAVASAESRAAVAEARCSDLEAKIGS